jgi:UDP-N-acetylglucosamine:LPS N-acetylglucosamine transferase
MQTQTSESLRLQVQGFVKNMPEWMAASDCVITKAGPGTIAEALIRGLPIVLNDFIAGQVRNWSRLFRALGFYPKNRKSWKT